MYLNEILQYLIWPAFILVSWSAIEFALIFYEKKFQEKEETSEKSS
jgi:hypothetical protein